MSYVDRYIGEVLTDPTVRQISTTMGGGSRKMNHNNAKVAASMAETLSGNDRRVLKHLPLDANWGGGSRFAKGVDTAGRKHCHSLRDPTSRANTVDGQRVVWSASTKASPPSKGDRWARGNVAAGQQLGPK